LASQVVQSHMREVWGSNPEPIKSRTRCQRLSTAATIECGSWHKATELGIAHSWHPKRY